MRGSWDLVSNNLRVAIAVTLGASRNHLPRRSQRFAKGIFVIVDHSFVAVEAGDAEFFSVQRLRYKYDNNGAAKGAIRRRWA